MARSVLVVFGIGSIGWAALALLAGNLLPDWMGLSGPQHGELYIESLSVNVGLWAALGTFALLGAVFQRLRLSAVLAFLVCTSGFAGGRIFGLASGAEYGVYTMLALALEVAIIVAAASAYVSEKARLSREAKEQQLAEKAALEAALAAEQPGQATPPETV